MRLHHRWVVELLDEVLFNTSANRVCGVSGITSFPKNLTFVMKEETQKKLPWLSRRQI